MLEGHGWAEDITGQRHSMASGDVEWVLAGTGIWHTGGASGKGPQRGLQLWLALPPELELAPPQSNTISAAQVPQVGAARVLLGSYQGAHSQLQALPGVTYLEVQLEAGESWQFIPPREHEVAWLAVVDGEVYTPEPVPSGELVVFCESVEPITVTATQATKLVLGSAVKHRYPLVLGNYSVHTDRQALSLGEQKIHQLGQQLRQRGLI